MEVLQAAFEEGDVEALECVLKRGVVDANASTTTLFWAARKGHLDVVMTLLSYGVDVNTLLMNEFGHIRRSPLELACRAGHLDIVRVLLAEGADMHAVDECGLTALHLACSYGYFDIATELLAHGADVHRRTIFDRTVLHWALESNDDESDGAEMVRFLLKHGADANATRSGGIGLMHEAIMFRNVEMAKVLLLYGADVDQACQPMLQRVDVEDSVELMRLLLSYGVNLNSASMAGILHTVSAYHRIDLLKELLAHGADPNLKKDGKTPLRVACERRQTDAVKTLLTHGADPNAIDSNGKTELQWAAHQGGPIEIVVALLTHGADVAATDQNGMNALHLTAQYKHAKVTSVLLAHGADANKVNKDGKGALHFACEVGNRKVVTALLACGVDSDVRDVAGDTPLHLAARGHHVSVVEVLLSHGSSVHARNERGETPLASSLHMNTTSFCMKVLSTAHKLMSAGAVYEESMITTIRNSDHTQHDVVLACVQHWAIEQSQGKSQLTKVPFAAIQRDVHAVQAFLQGTYTNLET